MSVARRFQIGAGQEGDERRVRKVSDQDIARWSRLLIVASREAISALDRLRIVYRLLDEYALLLWGARLEEKHVRLVEAKCGVRPPREKVGEWLLSHIYSRDVTQLYISDRLERLRCIAEAMFSIIVDLRR